MSTERSKGHVGFICDGPSCFESTDEYPSHSFSDLLEDSKRAGWIIYEGDGEWVHKCPACAEDGKRGETDLQRARRLLG